MVEDKMLIVKSAVSDKVRSINCDASKDGKCRVGGDFNDGLNEAVDKLIIKAVDRAKSNGRVTVGKQDV